MHTQVRATPRLSAQPEHMQILMFVTDDGASPEGTGPTLFVKDDPTAFLPAHPRGYSWRYFASVGLDDAMLLQQRSRIDTALGEIGWLTLPQLVFAASARHEPA